MHYWEKASPCTVCGSETEPRSQWFLLLDDPWLDRLRVLSWHPSLAGQPGMHGVCGKGHLKMLLAHWLTEADLQFPTDHHFRLPLTNFSPETAATPVSCGRFVGELSVYRDSMSPFWGGSPEELECIMEALETSCKSESEQLQSFLAEAAASETGMPGGNAIADQEIPDQILEYAL